MRKYFARLSLISALCVGGASVATLGQAQDEAASRPITATDRSDNSGFDIGWLGLLGLAGLLGLSGLKRNTHRDEHVNTGRRAGVA